MRNFRDVDATLDVSSIFCLAYASDEYVEQFLRSASTDLRTLVAA
jgi:hypothetical protein